MGSKICETVQNLRGAVKMANVKGLQAEKAEKGVVGCGRTSAQNAKGC